MLVPCSLPTAKVLDGSPIEVTLAKPVDKDSYVRYTRGTGGRAPVLQGDYTYTLGHLYDPTTAYLGAPVFYAPQAYAAIPNLHFPAAKGLGSRSVLRPPSVRGNSPRATHLLRASGSCSPGTCLCQSCSERDGKHRV